MFLFCIKQANKICTLQSSHLLAFIVFSVRCFCFMRGILFLVSHPNTNPAEQGLTSVNSVRCSEGTLKLVVKRSCEGTCKLSTCQLRSQCFSLLFYLLFFRDWNAVVQYHTIQCLLIFCNKYHRQPSVCFTEASRLKRDFRKELSALFAHVGHYGKYHNTFCLSPQILHKHCFQFLLGLTMVPRENKKNASAKFGGTNKKYYGIF